MNHAACKLISIVLILCVLFVGGLAQAQAAEHAGDHAQHHTATHGTLLCSWMCAAGQGLESAVAPIHFELTPLEWIEFAAIDHLPIADEESLVTRGPPQR